MVIGTSLPPFGVTLYDCPGAVRYWLRFKVCGVISTFDSAGAGGSAA